MASVAVLNIHRTNAHITIALIAATPADTQESLATHIYESAVSDE